MSIKLTLLLCISASSLFAAQHPADKADTSQPALPVVNSKSCPFEGCSFRKWLVKQDFTLYSTWEKGHKSVTTVKSGQVVTGLTGVHITFTPDRVQVLQPLPELGVQPGDTILRYMYHGEGFADIWAKGKWWKEYDCSFIQEKDGSGCTRNCPAKVIEDGRKEWWVQIKASDGSIGWTKAEDQFDCMDSLGGDPKCDALNASATPPPAKR